MTEALLAEPPTRVLEVELKQAGFAMGYDFVAHVKGDAGGFYCHGDTMESALASACATAASKGPEICGRSFKSSQERRAELLSRPLTAIRRDEGDG